MLGERIEQKDDQAEKEASKLEDRDKGKAKYILCDRTVRVS